MKSGRSLTDLALELKRQLATLDTAEIENVIEDLQQPTS